MVSEAEQFQTFFTEFMLQQTISGWKDTSFSFVTIFEYLYPISAFCPPAQQEVAADSSARYNILFRRDYLIPENILRKLGTILLNLLTLDDCINPTTLNGECAGIKIGTAVNLILLI